MNLPSDSPTREVEITRLAHGGDGVCRVDGQVCFVPYALPGDRLRIAVRGESKGVLRAVVDEVLELSPARREAACPVFGRCGGCTWLHFAYPDQADWKRRIVRDCFERIGKREVEVGWLDDPGLRLAYRTRAVFRGEGGRRGFFESGSHTVVDIESCPLCHPALNKALERLRSLHLDTTVEIVVNPDGGEALVWSARESQELRQAFIGAGSPNDRNGRAQFLFDGVPIVNGAFSQSSLILNRLLVATVHRMAAGAESVLDLYCGNGNLTLGLPASVNVRGMDRNRPAVKSANALGHGRYTAGKEPAFIRAIRKAKAHTILLDPPRSGAKRISSDLATCDAERIVYVSCDPATLARDAARLVRGGRWKIGEVTAIDLFPHTAHCETVVLFKRP